jgi:hypothetical protein
MDKLLEVIEGYKKLYERLLQSEREKVELFKGRVSCPKIGLHNSKQKWRDIQKCLAVNGKVSTVKNLNVRFVGNI